MTNQNTTKVTIMKILENSENQNLISIAKVLPLTSFFHARCHSHHHYYGGLADHSLGVTNLLLANEQLLQQYGRENLIFAGMFHDLCKSYFYPWHRFPGHGKRSVKILSEYFHIQLHDDVYDAIRNHMHRSNSRHNPLWEALRHADHQNAATCS